MSLVHRMMLGTFLRHLGSTLVGALILFTLVDLFDHIGSLLDNDASLSMILRYYLYKAAWIIDTVLPLAMLMATLFTVGSMARYLELTALFAAGMSLIQVTRPLLIASLLTAVLSFAWREFVLPAANVNRSRVWEVEIHNRPDTARPTRDIALIGADRRLYFARKYDPTSGVVTDLKILATEGPRVVERIDARRAEWDGEHWILQDGTHRVFEQETEVISNFTRLTVTDLAITPDILYSERVSQEDMNIRQLRVYNRLIRQTGGDPTTSSVDIHFLIAFPLVNVIVVFLGILLASGPRKTTIASGFGLTVLVSFGYYLFMNFGRALGHNGAVPPIVAAWTGNVVYTVIGWVMWANARR